MNLDDDEDGFSRAQGDCNDNNMFIYPNVDEICDNGDNNCDGEIDENNICFEDADGDGVADENDICPETATGEIVDELGCSSCQKDNDNDGTPDCSDLCPLDSYKTTMRIKVI